MKIYGVSQTSGVERRLYVERGADGIVLIISDHEGNKERQRVLVLAEDLLRAVTDPAPGGSTVEGAVPPHGPRALLKVEVRRNEVWLTAGPVTGETSDVAVGLDDFQDALEAVLSRG
jgi:hypothetical protein